MKPIDFIGAIELAYDRGPDDDAWLQQLTRVVAPAFSLGAPTTSFFFQLHGDHATVGTSASIGDRPYSSSDYQHLHDMGALQVAPRTATSAIRSRSSHVSMGPSSRRGCCARGHRRRRRVRPSRQQYARLGRDLTTVVPPGSRLLQRALWSRLAAHIGCALRLRGSRDSAAPDSAAAVLSPTGRLEHATSAAIVARQHLTASAKGMDRARGKLRRLDPEEASSLWRAMVRGQWSLVDWVDHDGKRFILAQDNPVRSAPSRPLSEREEQVVACAAMGHSNKLIAYDLGLSPSTVSVLLGRAARKLGVGSRVALIRAVRERSEERDGDA